MDRPTLEAHLTLRGWVPMMSREGMRFAIYTAGRFWFEGVAGNALFSQVGNIHMLLTYRECAWAEANDEQFELLTAHLPGEDYEPARA